MPLQMSESSLVALIESMEADCYGESDGTLSRERAEALDRYNGLLLGNEVTGRSAAISTDLRDTVEAVLPQLLRIFLSGDEVVRFDPRGPEDDAPAQRETDYCNFVLTQRNNAFVLFSTWFRDALLQKNGYVKAWWETRSDVVVERYEGLNGDALAVLMADQCVQISAHTEYPDPYMSVPAAQAMSVGMGMSAPAEAMLHDVEVRRVKAQGFVKVENVPCEEILVHSSHRDVGLENCIFIEHRTNKTLSEIRQMGIDCPDDWAGEEYDATGEEEAISRDRFDEINQRADDSVDPATRRATYKEIYARIDEDGDGIAELRRICMVNRHVVVDEETDLIPFACVTPVIQPHRHIGYGYYDFLKEIELAHTALLRIFFDNNYLSVNGRYAISDRVNVDDLLVSRPGGLVRVQGSVGDAIMPLTHPSTGESALAAMTYLDQWKKQATGVVLDAQVLSADVLNNSTATGISQAISVWQARIEAVARCFAETGVKELFRIVHALTLKHADSEERVRIDQTWQTIDPREWVRRTDMTVTVGLGTGSREMKVQFLNQALGMQGQAMMAGLPIVQPQNIYETSKELWKEMGYRDTSRFLTDPAKAPPKGPPPPPEAVQVAQIKAQSDQERDQIKAQADTIKDQAKAQAQTQVEAAQMQADIAVARMQAEYDAQRKALETQYQMQMDAFRASKEQETQLQMAQIKAAVELESARLQAGLAPTEDDPSDRMRALAASVGKLARIVRQPRQLVRGGDGRAHGMTVVDGGEADAAPDADADPLLVLAASIEQLAQAAMRPKQIVRGPDGRATGVQ